MQCPEPDCGCLDPIQAESDVLCAIYNCPECGGSFVALNERSLLRFVCVSPFALIADQVSLDLLPDTDPDLGR